MCSCRVMAWEGWVEGWLDGRTEGQTERGVPQLKLTNIKSNL